MADGSVERDSLGLSALSLAVRRLGASGDIDALFRLLAETLLELEAVAAVEARLFASRHSRFSVEYSLHVDGTRTPLLIEPRDSSILDAMVETQAPFFAPLSGVGVEPHVDITHVLVVPLPAPDAPEMPPLSLFGGVFIGFAEAPNLSSACRHTIDILVSCVANRIHSLLSEQARYRHTAHMALVRDVSAMTVQPSRGEQLFSQALQRVEEVFDLDVAAIYAGQPLTLRAQFGGRVAQVGEAVPEGLAYQASRRQQPMVVDDLTTSQDLAVPRWTSCDVRSEVALPLRYQKRSIGVLDLFSSHPATFDHVDMETLVTLSHYLAILIVQERWDNQAYPVEQVRQAYDRLQEFTELKEQILQNVSHELRMPLTLIKGYLELIMDGQMGDVAPEQQQSLQVVLRKVDEVVRIVEQIVTLSPHTHLSIGYQKISVRTLLKEMSEVFVRRTEGSSIVWDFHVGGDDLYIGGDLDKIRQVCYNILDNSVKFSPNGGCISVQATAEQDYVHLAFADEGIGIPQPRLTRIFETFYQVDGSSTRRFGGLGLGLAVVNRAVAAHHGKVWAESDLGKGSAFHVLLPKYESARRLLSPTGYMEL